VCLVSIARLLVAILAAVALVSTASADTTVLVGTSGTAGPTLTGGIESFAVTNSGSTWTQSNFNSDSWSQTIAAGVNGLTQDIYGNVYAGVNTGTNTTVGIQIYRQTGGGASPRAMAHTATAASTVAVIKRDRFRMRLVRSPLGFDWPD
jgi:hypothetical protein